MEKFIPYEKLSKKQKRELNAKKRRGWNGLNPVTRKPQNPKAYNRKKAQHQNDFDTVPLFFSDIISGRSCCEQNPAYRQFCRHQWFLGCRCILPCNRSEKSFPE